MNQHTIKKSLPFVYRYFERTNEILGMVGFAAAFACISTENPVFYAFIALFFILLAWIDSFRHFKTHLDLLSTAGVAEMKKWETLKRCRVGIAGAFVLSMVAQGYLDKYGLNLDLESKSEFKLRTNPETEKMQHDKPLNAVSESRDQPQQCDAGGSY